MFVNGRYIGPWFQQNDGGAAGGGSGAGAGQQQGENSNAGQNQQQQQNQNQQQSQQEAKPVLREALTDEQRRQYDSDMAAARRQAEADAKTKFDADATKAADQTKLDKERDDQIKAGQFEEARKGIEGERDKFKLESETSGQRVTRLEAILKPQLDETVKNLPTALADQFPKDADLLDQLEWLSDPRTKAVLDAAGTNGEALTRIPGAPKPGSKKPVEISAERKTELKRTGSYDL